MRNKTIQSFIDYADAHPEQRFWQVLRNWSGFNFTRHLLQGGRKMKTIDYIFAVVIFFSVWVVLTICIVPTTIAPTIAPTLIKESYKERYDVYSRCYEATNDYQKALACIEIHKYLQGE